MKLPKLNEIPTPVILAFIAFCVFLLVQSMRNMWKITEAANQRAAHRRSKIKAGDENDSENKMTEIPTSRPGLKKVGSAATHHRMRRQSTKKKRQPEQPAIFAVARPPTYM